MTIKERKQHLLTLISDAKPLVMNDNYGRMYSFGSLPEKRRKDLFAFDPHLDYEDFVGMYATGLFRVAKEGFAFMLDGLYFDDSSPRHFVKYSDIMAAGFYENNDKLKDFYIFTSKGKFYNIYHDTLRKDTGGEAFSNLLRAMATFTLQHGSDISHRVTGEVTKHLPMTADVRERCKGLIQSVAANSAVVGFGPTQTPLAENPSIGPLQVEMAVSLGRAFGIELTSAAAKRLVMACSIGYLCQKAAQLVAGWIPIEAKDNIARATTAAALTQEVGWSLVYHFIWLRDEAKKSGHKKAETLEERFKIAAQEFKEEHGATVEGLFQFGSKAFDKKIIEDGKLVFGGGIWWLFMKIITEYENLIVMGVVAGEDEAVAELSTAFGTIHELLMSI